METLVVPYNKMWDYMHPMGRNPALEDPDFDSTWWLSLDRFIVDYDGPSFTDSPPHSAGDVTTINSGSGPGPLGYGAVDNFLSGSPLLLPLGGGPPITSLGTVLTTPLPGNRRAGYYRTTFTTSQTLLSPVLRCMVDDGCVIFLDGVQIARLNLTLPASDSLPAYLTTTALGDGTLLPMPESTENTLYTINLSSPGNQGTAGGLQATVINPVPSLSAGTHTLAVFVCSLSSTNSDQLMALQLTAENTGIDARASGITRNLNGTPTNPSDDTFEFDVNVNPLNAGNSGWTSDSTQHPAGNYSLPYHFSGFPVTGNATIGFADAEVPALTSAITVEPPSALLWIGQNRLPGQTGPLFCTEDSSVAWVQAGDEIIRHNNGDGTVQLIESTVVSIPAEGAAFSAMLEFADSSTIDNFEEDDTIEILLRLDDGSTVVEVNLIPAILDVNSNGVLNGYSGFNYNDNRVSDELNLAAFAGEITWNEGLALSHVIPPGILTAQLIIRAANDDASETFRFRDALFSTDTGPADRDGDAISDSGEFAAGTDPFDPASGLEAAAVRFPGTILITFPSVAGRTYRLVSSEDLITWSQELATAISGDGNIQEFAVSTTSARKFLSVQVRRGLQPFP